MIQESQNILCKQKRVLIAIVATSITIAGFYYLFLSGSRSFHVPSSNQSAIILPTDKVNHQEIWMSQIESQNKKIENQTSLIEQKLNYLQEILVDQKKKEQQEELNKEKVIKEIAQLKAELNNVSERNLILPANNIYSMPVASPPISHSHLSFDTPEKSIFEPTLEEPRPPLNVVSVETRGEKKNKPEPIEGKIFAGTTVQALLISSVDAVCGVFSNSDPVPVKLRILDNGHLPKQLIARLKGGLVIGSAFGNISNERVYIRLERMSLFNSKGEGVEMEVAGYVSGEDGCFGLRGNVIDKSTKMVKNAALSGFLSGTGQILQSAVTKRPIENWNNYSAIGGETLKQGCASGAGDAFEMLADYYIKRAEQVQPVLQVNAGRIVDITFTYGTSMGDLHVKEKINACRLKYKGVEK